MKKCKKSLKILIFDYLYLSLQYSKIYDYEIE